MNWFKEKAKTLRQIVFFFAKLGVLLIAAVGIFIFSVIIYIPAMFASIAQQFGHGRDDLVLNEKNEIIEGSVESSQYPLNVKQRPQPTWY